MNGNSKAFRITAIGGLAALLLALVVVLMANPAAASGSGDWPPPGTGDWVINQPTTVIDEGFVYLWDQNITINSQLTVYNSYIYMDNIIWYPAHYAITVNVGGTFIANETYFDAWTPIHLRVHGTMKLNDCYFDDTEDFNITSRGTANINDTTFDDVYNNITIAGNLDMTYSFIRDVFGTFVISGTSTMDDVYIDDVDHGFWISGTVKFNDTDIRYVDDAFNVSGNADMVYMRFYRVYNGMNLMGTVDIDNSSLQYIYELALTGTVNLYNNSFYRMYDGMRFTGGSIKIDECLFRYVYYGVYINRDVVLKETDFLYMYHQGIYLDNCNAILFNVTIDVYSGYYDYYVKTDRGWSYEDRFPVAIGTGLWVSGGNPSFVNVDVEADAWAQPHIEYTGNADEVTLYVLCMAATVLIDSPAMTTVKGLTVHDSSFPIRSYVNASNPGANPKYLWVDFMGVSAGIGVVNYSDTTITDVVSYNNRYSSIYGPYVSDYSISGGGWRTYGPRVNVGAGFFGSPTSAPSPVFTIKDITVDDGTDWFGHMYYAGYSGTGNPVLSDTVLIENVTVKSARGTVFGFDIRPAYDGKRDIDIDVRITNCHFEGVDQMILFYQSNAGPGIDPAVNMVDVTEDILVDNNTITESGYSFAYFYIDSVRTNHKSDKWDRTVTFADNDFVDTQGVFFYVQGLNWFDRGSCTLNVLNNNMDNATDRSYGPIYAYYYDTIRFVGNTMQDMAYRQSGDFYDSGGDSNGVNPVDWLFKDNVIVNCTNEAWSEIIFLEFGGAVVVQANDISMGNGFLSMYHVTMWTGKASLDILDNEYYDMTSYMAEFGNTGEGNKDFVCNVKDNHIYNTEDFFLDFYGSSSTINTYDRDAIYNIEDNVFQNNSGGFIHIWGDVKVTGNDFFDNAGPILYIEYINLNPPDVGNNRLANNVDLYLYVAKDKGFELVPFKMTGETLTCSGTALGFVNMEVTLDMVDITGAAEPIWVHNSIVNAYSSHIDGDSCTVETDGMITTWWPVEVKVTWGDASGTDSKTPVANALVVFYDAGDNYYTSAYAGTDGILPQNLYMEWSVGVGGMTPYSPYEVKAASSGATNGTLVTLDMDLIGADAVHILLWDVFAPVVAITEPYDGAIFNKDSIETFGFVTEVGSGLDFVEFSLDGTTWNALSILPSGDWTLVLSNLEDGETTLMVRASDIASNLATTSVTITIDTMAPDLTIGTIPQRTNNPDLLITGTIEVGADLYINGIFEGTAESSSLMIEHTLHEGKNVILLEAMDAARNMAFETVETVLDTITPVLVVNGPAYGMVTNQDTVKVLGIVEMDATLTVGGTPVIPNDDGTFEHTYTLSDGDNMIEVKATDLASNVATVTVLVVLDQDPPYVELIDPSQDVTVSTSFIEVHIRADADATLWLNGRPTANDEDFTRTVLLLEGENLIVVKAMDPAGNVAEDSVKVTLDTMPPVLVVTDPAGLVVWTNQMTITVSGFAYNATEVLVNGEGADSFNPSTGAFSHSVSLANGENNITVEAKDAANTVTHGFKAMVNTADPKLVVHTIESPVTTASVTISGETDAGIPTVMAEEGGQMKEFPVNYDGTFSFTLNFENGSHSVKVQVEDKYGNEATEQTNSFDVKQKDFFPDGDGEGSEGFTIEPMHIGLLLAVIGITLIVAAFWAAWKISRRGE